MKFPNNIKREHILKAIERIDNGDIPENSTSKYYDLVFNSKFYSPKLVVSFANSYINGVDLDRNSFDGGPGKPAFKLLEKEGFEIIEKIKIPKIKLYDIHGKSLINAESLLADNLVWFYWDDNQFKKYKKGDVVFWVNRLNKKALYTIVDETEIKPTFENGKNYIRENGIEVFAIAEDENTYKNFIRFKVEQIINFSNNWNYEDPDTFKDRVLAYILYENDVSNDIGKRISKIDDLLSLFTSGDAISILNNAKELLNEKKMTTPNILLPEILEALEDGLIITEMNRVEFRFKLAQDALEKYTNFENPDPNFYQIQKDNFKGVGLIEYLNSLDINTEEYKLFKLIAELYSYCDLRMPSKQSFNQYDDLRTIADSGIWQYAWVVNLLKYKIEGNSIENLTTSIKNAFLYLIDPINANTMLNIKHRVLFCDVFLNGKSFDKDTFIDEYLNFFEPYNIKSKVSNPLNYTEVLDLILYKIKSVRNLWVDNQKKVIKATNSTNNNIYQSFKNDTNSIGLIFTNNQILRYITSLCTKPFVILTGLSGSGKTKLAQSFSKWLCTDNNQYSIVAVGADWTNREPLLGYPNSLIDGQYVTPESGTLDLILRAIENYNFEKRVNNQEEDISKCKPYFLILDEMNLSHVERYFADFLSAMESGEEIKLYSGGSRSDNKGNIIPNSFKLPPNLFIVGTVNIDETTYMFSPKVLDRANTIEFRIEENELNEFFKSAKNIKLDELEDIRQEIYENEFMMMSTRKNNNLDDDVKNIFKSYFNVLKIAGAEFGYRTLNEIAILINFIGETYDSNKDKDKKEFNNSIDIAIMQKLLPKLHGSRSKMIKILPILGDLCLEKASDDSKLLLDAYLNGEKFNFDTIKYHLSFNKICRMYKNAIENGFVSYAEA